MTIAEKLLDFCGYRVWCLSDTGDDLAAATVAIAAGVADGMFVSRMRGFAGSDLDALTRVQGLRILGIGDAEGVDLTAISQVASLEFLSIETVSGAVNFDFLSKLQHLRCTITEERGLPILRLPALRQLAVWNFGYTNLLCMKNFPSLVSLELIQARRLISLDGIEQAKNLEFVSIAYCPKLEDIRALAVLPNVVFLELESVKKITAYGAIARLRTLTKLKVIKAAPMTDLEFLGPLKKLESVVIRQVDIASHDLGPLMTLPVLSHIYLDNKKECQPLLGALTKLVESRN